jgi:molecular chaperone DnaK
MIYTAEKAIKENKEKIPAEVVTGVEEKISALRAIKDAGELDAVKKATEELSTEMSKIGEAMSKAGAMPDMGFNPNPGAPADGGAEAGSGASNAGSDASAGPETENKTEEDNVRDAETK